MTPARDAAAPTLRGDLAVLRQMLRGIPRSGSHAQNLEGFYATQAPDYDRFRERLLRGRAELIADLAENLPPRAHVVELGGGTGRNLDFFGARLAEFGCFDLVDLCPALLARARARLAQHGNVRIVEADATTFVPEAKVDCVYFSYALTMIPDWRAAIANAMSMLKPGGVLGVVDFYHSTENASPPLARHGWFTRTFWRRWFAHDGVHLDPLHLHTLRMLMPRHELRERHAAVPYLPGLRVPYYAFVGHKD
jgi:S-adenosylmethionine-diacylgycerolhomoserine-N-methlytransferase